MIEDKNVETFKEIAKMQVDLIPGGAIFLIIQGDTFVWKAASKTFDVQAFSVGEKIDDRGATALAIKEKRTVNVNVPRILYGMRLSISSSPIIDEKGEVVGAISIVFPILHPVATAFGKFAPLIAEMFPEGAFLYISDLTKIAYRQASSRFDLPTIAVGNELKETDEAYKVVKTQKASTFEFDSREHGVPMLFMTYPLFDDENKIVGSLGMVLPKINASHLREMSNSMDTQLEGISAATQQLAASATQIHDSVRGLNDIIVQINEFTEKINNISGFIKQVADQTNMLGLNAAIEAARAGDAGRGFGVVAQEIRKLSEQSRDTVTQISELTNSIKEKIDEAIKKGEISLDASQEQAAATEEITVSIEEVTNMSVELSKIAQTI